MKIIDAFTAMLRPVTERLEEGFALIDYEDTLGDYKLPEVMEPTQFDWWDVQHNLSDFADETDV